MRLPPITFPKLFMVCPPYLSEIATAMPICHVRSIDLVLLEIHKSFRRYCKDISHLVQCTTQMVARRPRPALRLPLYQALELPGHTGVEWLEDFILPAHAFLVVNRHVSQGKIIVRAREVRF